MKNLLLVLADLAMNKGSSYRWIAALTMGKLRTISMVLIMSILCITFISSALNLVLLDLQQTTASQQQLAMTSVSAVGFGIIILSFAAICLFFRKSVWGLSVATAQEPQAKSEPQLEYSPIVQALSVLVMDIVDERRNKRQRDSEHEEQIHVQNS